MTILVSRQSCGKDEGVCAQASPQLQPRCHSNQPATCAERAWFHTSPRGRLGEDSFRARTWLQPSLFSSHLCPFLTQLGLCLQCVRHGFDLWVRKVHWRREWHPTLVFLPGEVHGQRSLVDYSPWGPKESDMTE